jgi:galactokinase
MSAQQRLTAVAPARVNLIGEHTDYTGGLVLPMAIPFYTEATIEPATDGVIRMRSERFSGEHVERPEERQGPSKSWSDYPVGVLREFEAKGLQPEPFLLSLRGDVPLGSGLSSSASVEVATAYALLGHMGSEMKGEEVALLCQRAENHFVGAPSGIMDQTISVMGQEGHALLLNTRTLEYQLVPMNRGAIAECAVVVCNSMVKHSIGGGEYGKRRKQVEEGQAAIVKAHSGIQDLGDATESDLEDVRGQISAEAYKRCRHIITENARVRLMREALEAGDAEKAGELMVVAHASERDDFECSVDEVDFLVDTAVSLPGCYGARLTGGGFGGCTVNLVRKDVVAAFTEKLRAAYLSRFGIDAEVFVCEPVDGALRRAQKAGTVRS